MHCFACNLDLMDNSGYDKPTSRYYCLDCFEATNEVILSMEDKELEDEDTEDSDNSLISLVNTINREGWQDIVSVDEEHFEFTVSEQKEDESE